jgi:cytochrome c-type biogenesis protein CcmE
MTPRRWALVLVGVFALTFGWLLYGGLDKNIVFFLTPKELLAKGSAGVDIPLRLGGQVKPGSVVWDAQTLDLRFAVVDGAGEIVVRQTGAPPQMFRDGIGVVVEGRFGHDSVFHATSLMVKHSNEYHPPKAGETPKDMYKTLIKGPTP